MRQSLRKGTAHVHVTYRNGNYTNNLNGMNFEVQADEQRVTLSIDMSGNQRAGSESSNSYADVIELQEDAADIHFIQLDMDGWLSPLLDAMKEHRYAIWQVEFAFKDGRTHVMPFRIHADNGNLTLVNTH